MRLTARWGAAQAPKTAAGAGAGGPQPEPTSIAGVTAGCKRDQSSQQLSSTSPPLAALATPLYTAKGPGRAPTYRGFVVVRAGDPRLQGAGDGADAGTRANHEARDQRPEGENGAGVGAATALRSLAGAKANSCGSYSGCVGPRAAVAALFPGQHELLFFDPDVLVTGSHRASIEAVAAGQADVACIDCVTWAPPQRTSGGFSRPPAWASPQVVAQTAAAPAPPFLVPAALAGTAVAAALFHALEVACDSPPAAALGLCGVVPAEPSEPRAAFAVVNAAAAAAPIDGRWAAIDRVGYHKRLDLCGYGCILASPAPECQRWLSRGMLLYWAFNHAEALACFNAAAVADPACRVAPWAAAQALATNYNKATMTVTEMRRASDYAAEATALIAAATSASSAGAAAAADPWGVTLGKPLVQAQQARFVKLPTTNLSAASGQGACDAELDPGLMAQLGEAYATEMRQVYATLVAAVTVHQDAAAPGVADVAALFVEALLLPRPWKLWPATPETEEAQQVLEAALHCDDGTGGQQRHPGLCHYHVHLLEMAPTKSLVGRAVGPADAPRSQWPACGHLLHMASHIDVHLGRYAAVVATNAAAIRAGKAFAAPCGTQNYYFTYRLHTLNQMMWPASFDGQRAVAFSAAEAILVDTPPKLHAQWPDWVEPLGAGVWYVLVRFGQWADVLDRAVPGAPEQFVSRAAAWWARAIALGALGRLAEAQMAQNRFAAAVAAVPPTRHIHNVPSSATLEVGAVMLEGELAYRRGEYDQAFSMPRRASALEQALPYDEPWGWMTPVAHALGALLAEQHRYDEAAKVFRADLERWPDNTWSLRGLARCLQQQGRPPGGLAKADDCCQHPELQSVLVWLAQAEARSDAGATHACFCAGSAP